MSDYPVFIMKAAEDKYMLIFKHNYMCLSSTSTLEDIVECTKQWYLNAHGDLYNYLMDCMNNLSYNPKPPEKTLLSRKTAEKTSCDMFDTYIEQALTQANMSLKRSAHKTPKNRLVKSLSTDKTSDITNTENVPEKTKIKPEKTKIKPKKLAKKNKPVTTKADNKNSHKKSVLKRKIKVT